MISVVVNILVENARLTFLLFSFTELIEERKCANNEEIVRERITKLQTEWEKLTKQSQAKSRYLKESNELQQYNNNVKELDYWLGEVRNSYPMCWLIVQSSEIHTSFDSQLALTIRLVLKIPGNVRLLL